MGAHLITTPVYKKVAGGGPVAVVDKGTHSSSASGTTYDYTGLTITGGLTHSAMALVIFVENANVSGMSVTWDNGGTNQSMTQVGTILHASDKQIFLFGLVAPTSGNKTAHLAWTGTAQVTVFAMSFSGVNQSSVASAFVNFNSGTFTGTSLSLTITSAANDVAVCFAQTDVNAGTLNQTVLFQDGLVFWFESGQDGPGAATVTFTGSASLTSSIALGCDVVAG
jgi:hypothetical protein